MYSCWISKRDHPISSKILDLRSDSNSSVKMQEEFNLLEIFEDITEIQSRINSSILHDTFPRKLGLIRYDKAWPKHHQPCRIIRPESFTFVHDFVQFIAIDHVYWRKQICVEVSTERDVERKRAMRIHLKNSLAQQRLGSSSANMKCIIRERKARDINETFHTAKRQGSDPIARERRIDRAFPLFTCPLASWICR